jgi:hypothetical protein
MYNLQIFLQIAVAVSVVYVWVFRLENVNKEFKLFGLDDLLRNSIGASKIVLSTFLIVGIWCQSFVFLPAILMAVLMVGAQYYHFKIRDPFIKYLPSLVLLIFCTIIAYLSI